MGKYQLTFLKRLKYPRMYSKHRKVQCYALVILALISISLMWKHMDTKQPPVSHDNSATCPEATAVERKQLFRLLGTTSKLLDHLHITHFLCYKSLWAAAQDSGPFPWDLNAYLCALNSPGLGSDEPTLLRTFRKEGLNLDYSSADANYKVVNGSLPVGSPFVQVTLFEEDPRLGVGMYRRVGWKRRLLPPNCDSHSSLECFPGFLVNTPLPKRTFGPLTLPSPRENIDLLKFHYPDTWHKPIQAEC